MKGGAAEGAFFGGNGLGKCFDGQGMKEAKVDFVDVVDGVEGVDAESPCNRRFIHQVAGSHFVKTLLNRILPLLVCIVAGTFLSWVSIYSFWFAIWRFHSVPVARACAAVGSCLLFPARHFFEWMGGDQTTVFS